MKLDSTSYAFVKKVEQYLRSLPIEWKNKTILIALSGGIDSCVLLDVLWHLKHRLEFGIAACHVNHNLRGDESNEDEQFVIQRTRDYDIPLTVRRFDREDIQRIQQGNLEEEARELRYQLLAHTAEELNYHYTATGHTKSDQAETVLHRLLRSSGIRGLSGIYPVGTIHQNTVIRPLLCHTRQHVLAYAQQHELPYRHDSMNEDDQYTRVKIRKHLLPLLKQEYNPNLEESLAKLASVCRDEELYWDQHVKSLFDRFGSATEDFPADRCSFLPLSIAEQRRLIRFWLQKHGIEPGFTQVDDAIQLLTGTKPQAEIHFSPEIHLIRRYDRFYFGNQADGNPVDVQKSIPVPGKVVIPELNVEVVTEWVAKNVIQMEKTSKWQTDIDSQSVKNGLLIRTWQEGDRIQPLGMKGTKSLKKIWQEHKIPRETRNRLPILCYHNEIVWIPGCCEAEPFKVTAETESMVRISIHPIE